MSKKVLIVGGGSAGWITAAYMDAAINGAGAKRVEIALVESEQIGRIGVGEATIPTLKNTLTTIGVGETEFMRATQATFKHGILFNDWRHLGHSYFHPFDRTQTGTAFDQRGVSWMLSDMSVPFADIASVQPRLAMANLVPRGENENEYVGPIEYAYHLDAELFADYLAELAMSRGVKRIVDTVSHVNASDDLWINSVKTASGRELTADFYVDCSGFASILQKKTQHGLFVDYSDWLFTDSAVTFRIPLDKCQDPTRKPYTTSTAMSSGWRWDITLQDRKGVGYVYSSKYMDDDDAEAELRSVLGESVDQLSARRLKFPTGRAASPWIGNCAAIGLSGGFIEPLESTGIYLIEFAVEKLCEHFPFSGGHQILSTQFNEIMRERYEEILPFIALHYCLTCRRDTEFWRDAKLPTSLPPSLKEMFQLWEHKPPTRSDFRDTQQLFSDQNYEYILFGLNWRPEIVQGMVQKFSPKPYPLPPNFDEVMQNFRTKLLDHDEWLIRNFRRAQVKGS